MTNVTLRGLRLLIVEDETILALLVEDLLGEMGCRVLGPAGSVTAALALLDAEDIDAALLDIDLGPGGDGCAVADALAARNVPFAFVTGSDMSELPREYRDRPTLQKPFPAGLLREAVLSLAQAI